MALIVPVAAPAILSFSMCVLCVFIDLLRSPSLRRDGVYFLSLFLYVCLCVYVFMQFMGQGATFTDYVQIRGCRKVAQKSVQVIYRSEVTFNTVLPHSILRL